MQPYVWCKRARGRGGLSNLPPVAAVPTGRRGFRCGELGGDGVDLDVLERVQLFLAGDGQVVKHLFGGRAGARWDGGRRLRSSLSECWGGEVDPMGGGARAGASEVDPMGGDARAGGGEADPKWRRRECWCRGGRSARTGIGRSDSLFGLFILIRAGSSAPGAPSPGAAEDFGFNCIAGLRASKGRGSGVSTSERGTVRHTQHLEICVGL